MNRVYLHYPFCTKLCHYCNFAAGISPKDSFLTPYHQALLTELNHHSQYYDFSTITSQSLYLGGGTPSLMPLDFMEQLFSFFTIHPQSEITLEINPETVTYEKAKIWFDLGINRVSLGWQTMNPQTLQFLGRTSTPQDNIRAFEILRKVGFQNISVDRILSITNDTDEEFLQAIKSCKPDHLSTYQLSIEDKTVLSLWAKQQKYYPIPDDKAIKIEEKTDDFLKELGYTRYETSNYSLPNKQGQHNLGYWNYDYWLGIGQGASGFLPNEYFGTHYRNHFIFKDYCQSPTTPEEKESIDHLTAIKEALMLGIRKREGIHKNSFSQRLKVKWSDLFKKNPDSSYFLDQQDTLILKKEMIPLSNPAILSLWEIINTNSLKIV